jgi:hypothetical protein
MFLTAVPLFAALFEQLFFPILRCKTLTNIVSLISGFAGLEGKAKHSVLKKTVGFLSVLDYNLAQTFFENALNETSENEPSFTGKQKTQNSFYRL